MEFLFNFMLFSEHMGSENELPRTNMAFSLWVSLSTLFLSLLSLLHQFVFRSVNGGKSSKSSICEGKRVLVSEKHNGETQIPEIIDSDEKEEQEFEFKFRFQTYEEFSRTNTERSSNRYEFLPEKSTSHFMEESEIPSFTVEVLNSHSNARNENLSTQELSEKDSDSQKGKTEGSQTSPRIKENVEDEKQFFREKDSVNFDFDTDSTTSSIEFPSENDGKTEEDLDSEELYTIDLDKEESEINEELKKIEEVEEQNSESGNSKWENEDSNELETEWEHQELVEQLKMELRKVRATGLPTIFEETESAKIMADLKPWKKIEEKYQHGDLMGELHKFYTTYRERMRKLDILNYQKMYAIGFLQSKDPLKSFSCSSKPSSPSLSSLISYNLRLHRHKKSQVDPMKNFIRELHSDLEMVYVGQMCLSWEFIQWQYGKALDLWESEPYGLHHYNEVAGEFQQFQVLLQRFIENEPFEGPRLENYVKRRCIARNLLQVPVIREDKQRDKKARRGRDKSEAVTSDMLVEILQESIRVVWQFIRADKDHNNLANNLSSRKKLKVELQDPADTQLLMEIHADLQKKEKKLKEIVRSGHCILKKLQKNEEDETGSDAQFFSQVDIKLVSRVLRMSRITTDQLAWCRNKLSRINFLNRKLLIEPSFFLFPC